MNTDNIYMRVQDITDNDYNIVDDDYNIVDDKNLFYKSSSEQYIYNKGEFVDFKLNVVNLSDLDNVETFIVDFKEYYDYKNIDTNKILNVEDTFLFCFNNQREYIELIQKDLKNTSVKIQNEIFNLFKSSELYFDSNDDISFEVKSKYNFLEFNENNIIDEDKTGSETDEKSNILSKTYEINMYDLIHVYIWRGNALFKNNVRQGLENKKLNAIFNTIVSNKYINEIKSSALPENEFEDLKNIFDYNDDKEDNLLQYSMFFTQHNGVTIIFKDADMEEIGNKIIFNYNSDYSVVNGAQTLSIFTDIYLTYSKNLYKYYSKETSEDKINYSNYIIMIEKLDNIFKGLTVKVNIINIKSFDKADKIINDITIGLNRQVQVKNDQIILGETRRINDIFLQYKNNIKIIKKGENEAIYNIKQLDFVKRYLCYEQMPGTSKNLNTNEMKKYLDEILEKIENEEYSKSFARYIYVTNKVLQVYMKEIIKSEVDENKKWFEKNSKNYFISFLRRSDYEDIDLEIVDFEFRNYYTILEEAGIEKNPQTFKKDELYHKLFSEKEKSIEEGNVEEEKIIEQITEERVNIKYPDTQFIEKLEAELNKNKNIYIDDDSNSKSVRSAYVRNIVKKIGYENLEKSIRTVKYDKLNEKIKEHYAFSESTFSEIVQNVFDDVESRFDTSVFHSELEKDLYIVVEIYNGVSDIYFKVYDINFLQNDYIANKAKEVYDKTEEKIKNGDRDFTKNTDSLAFHVRPHARDSYDTILYTDGSEITKRSFWLNNNILKDIIENKLNQEQE